MSPEQAHPGYWVHDLDPFLIRFPDTFPLEGIRYYGMAYALAFLCAWGLLVLYRRKGRSPLSPGMESDLLTWLILGVLIGGRLGYVLFYRPLEFLRDPLLVFQVWDGGMASHGGFLGVTIAVILYARRRDLPLWSLGDLMVTLGPPGLLLGRLANFINGELWGTVTKVPWAVIFPADRPQWDPESGVFAVLPRHPSQLYQAFLEGGVLLAYTQWRFWKRPSLPPGQLVGEFFSLYALIRIGVEFFREPDASLIAGLSRGQFYSLFLLLAGLGIIAWTRRHRSGS